MILNVRLVSAALLALAVAGPVSAETKMRSATQAEILQHLGESSRSTTVRSNGYTYRKGSSNGYKISRGKICFLLARGKTDCATVRTDGTKFRITTKDGNRTTF